ncbi:MULTISPECIES: glycine cleavage system aminomethyltransferase GcvT [Brevibacterium]|uniref:Aminomethyltransferase n=2 Tax=Bacteria TaxID=2 RepID=A0A161S3Z4_9MICO|nr:glycine cleavage system aminomethyltransferase GcvT [Brevibacterium casei]KZE17059.1 glycine cleavage system protein T [Brevibacterium casei]MBE4694745.1 glycine cleavage system aminomethyltransferase GcvT [Brevibacterium casei]MBY3577867.1 glycine cleavage system aminomethyltransferase GcvT [Brevibacterium casei]MCT1548896.1 glycine cleavage system aminomethyltransferase GcvT [Brevibacterium casei]MCT1561266.1 glycine cleavage system aminomethyltransferase GcvT [Brevibacterium casei]
MTAEIKETPLHETHAKLGATFTDFGGWDMPLKYGSELAEHRAVREAAGIFDLSHMGEVRITGAGAAAFLDYALVAKYSSMKVGKAKYGVIVNEQGYLLDDLITYRLGEEEFLIVPNASNTPAVVEALQNRLQTFLTEVEPGADVRMFDESGDTALIAVQGPHSQAIILAALDEGAKGEFGPRTTTSDEDPSGTITVGEAVDQLGYYAWMPLTIAGIDLILARTGYTGEDGFELYVPNIGAERLWDTLVTAGADHGLVPCGLAARDSLRLEAGMPLYGNELTLSTTPYDAGLGRMIGFKTKGEFVARDALAALGETEPERILVGLTATGRRAARSGSVILSDGAEVGVVTSGQPSPTLGHPIALAYLDRGLAVPGTEVEVDIRGKAHEFTVVELPFYRRSEN